MLGVTCNQIGIVFRKGHFIEDSILWVGKGFFAMCTPRANGPMFDGQDDRIDQLFRKTEFWPMQYVGILIDNFIVEQRCYSALE